MTAPDDGLAALLAEHSSWSEVCDVNVGWHYECSCGMTLPTNEGHTEAWEDLAAHQAAVVRAAGWMRVIPRSVRSSFDFDVATGRPLGPPEQEEDEA